MPEENQEKAITLITRKALVTFPSHMRIAVPIKGAACLTETAIIEYEVPEGAHRDSIPTHFKIIALCNGQKLTKGLHVSAHYGSPHALVELSDEDFQSLMRQDQ